MTTPNTKPNPQPEPEEAATPVSATVAEEVKAHMANPKSVPLPAGVVINFGDPVPVRKEG